MFKKKIPYGKHFVDQKDIEAVKKVLKKDLITQGPLTKKFENLLATYTGAKYSVTTNSASSALYLSCAVLGLKSGDDVWVSSISYVATANCALLLSCNISFLDISLDNFNIDTSILENKLKKTQKKNLPKVLIVTHLAGESCDLKKLYDLKKKYKFKIIEDASHALGSSYKKNKIGDAKYSDLVVFSFHPVKSITTAEGGAIMVNKYEIKKKLEYLKNNGIIKDRKIFKTKTNSNWYYEQHYLGGNFRMNELQAALGISQIKKLKKFINKRNEIADYYFNNLSNNLILPKYDSSNICSYHLFIIRLKKNSIKLKNKFYDYLKKNKIDVNFHYIPIYKHPIYKKKVKLPLSEKYYNSALSIPIYYSLKRIHQKKIIKIINNFVNYN